MSRQKLKKKKPSFRRVESWRYKRVKDSWRKARGIDSKTRKKKKSGVKSPTIGYRSPKKIRGLHPSGFEEIRIFTLNDFKGLSNKKHAIKISGRVGAKKRIALVDYAQNRGYKVLNLGISQKELESLESMLETSLEEEEYVDLEDLEESLDEDK
ncbi:MAG: 50S ribosomal protein L32e [Thermoplasmatales archaeon]|nr:MAG: 50S ribosomal protein L32e [Thermoplasmatales archaeon]